MAAILIRTEWAQNLLIKEATTRLSKSLNTRIQIKRVSFSLFNRMYLEGTLVEDKQSDTLLYAGAVKVSITDWFFLKDQAELEYIGLEDAVINMQRTDSIWNYQFLLDYFSSPPSSKPKKGIDMFLKKADLTNVLLRKRDGWRGQDMTVGFGSLQLDADEINFSKKKIFANTLKLDKPIFSIYNYPGKRVRRPSSNVDTSATKDELEWNSDDWDVLIREVTLKDGLFQNDKYTERKPFDYFDGNHIEFSKITGTLKNLSWQKDTISADLKLSTKERSGFTVKSISARLSLHPKGMIFKNLDIQTPSSHLRNYYAMRYEDFDEDMSDFLRKVQLEGRFDNSTVSSNDLAYFAPELKKWNKNIRIDGNVAGKIDSLSARNFHIEAGRDTKLNGDIKMVGLPDIEKTYISFRSNDFQTTYADAITLVPDIKDIKEPNINELGFLRFRGTYNGFIRDFVANGTIETALGTVTSDINMKLPKGKEPSYSGTVNTESFDLGKLIGSKDVGKIAFNGGVKGTGFKTTTGAIDVDGGLKSFEFNNYVYHNIELNGNLHKKLFSGKGYIDDPNLKMNIDGSFNLNGEQPEFNLLAVVHRSNLKALNFAKDDIHVIGKFKMNFTGKTIDDFIGEASLFDVAVTKADETFVFDSLELNSYIADGRKQITVSNSDVNASINGIFTLRDLPNTFTYYMNKYYPTYFSAPSREVKDQDFSVQIDVKNLDQYLQLFNKDLKGFDYSKLNGEVNTTNKSLSINLSVPYASYKNFQFSDFALRSADDNDSLRVFVQAGRTIIDDSLQFPTTSINVSAAKDVSLVRIETGATQTINAANLLASVTALKDGVRIHFDPSTVVLNDKTWKIEKDGELTFSRSFIDASEIKLTNGEQEILVSSIPSEIGNSNDVLVNLRKVNLGDFVPYLFKQPRIQGITNAEITVEDPFNRLRVYVNAQTEQMRFENDSIGITTLNAFWDNSAKRATFHMNSDNNNYKFKINGSADMRDSLNQQIDASINVDHTSIKILERYIGGIFGELKGYASGNLNVTGNIKEPDIVGTVHLHDGGLKILYTQCYYNIADATILFKPDEIDFGEITLTDKFNNPAQLKGTLHHNFFKNFEYNFTASTPRLLVLNTFKTDNSTFYGNVIGRAMFRFTGPEENMKMYVSGEPVDSSTMYVNTSTTSKQKGEVDFIVWKQYGREMNRDSLVDRSSNLVMDLDLTGNRLLKMNVILDELTGDIITATGSGSLKIHTGSAERMTLNGRYNIDNGKYLFNFQDIFNKPFILEPGSGSYISWTGDPYDAEINVNAAYIAEKVRISTLFDSQQSSSGVSTVSSDVLKELSDVRVLCNLTGTLSKPNPTFQIELPQNSPVRTNPAVDSKLKTINRDENEVSKQATYLIVFKSFAPQSAIVTSDINTELINTTISGVINMVLANSVQNFFYKLFGSSVDVNFNYSRMLTNPTGVPGATASNSDTRENVSLQFIKSLLNNKLVITFASDFNFATTGASTSTNPQGFLFLPDVTVEYKITADGKFRTSFFYRSSFDALSTSGKKDRTGGNLSYRTEFDNLFRKKKKTPKAEPQDSDAGAATTTKGSE